MKIRKSTVPIMLDLIERRRSEDYRAQFDFYNTHPAGIAFYLKNPIAYYLGADIWGFLYDRLARDAFFSMLRKPDGLYESLLGHLKPILGQISAGASDL